MALVSCGSNTEKSSNKEPQKVEEKQQQPNETKTEQPERTAAGNKWPSDIPDYVPLPESDFSEIQESKSTEMYSQSYIINFKNMKDTADSYQEKLISSGWTIRERTDLDSLWVINAVYGKGIAYLNVLWEEEEKEGTFVLGVVRSGSSESSKAKDDSKPGNEAQVSGKNWPTWVPDIIPLYQYGTVFMAMKQNDGGSIIFTDVRIDRDPYSAYKKDLLDKGWQVDEETENDQAKHLHVKHDGYWLTYAFPKDGEGVSIYFGNDGKENGKTSNGSTGGQPSQGDAVPSGVPDYVPLLKGGIISSGRDENNERIVYYFVYENIEDVSVESYEDQLSAKGWTVFLVQEVEDSWIFHAKHEKEGDLIVTVNKKEKRGSINFGMDK